MNTVLTTSNNVSTLEKSKDVISAIGKAYDFYYSAQQLNDSSFNEGVTRLLGEWYMRVVFKSLHRSIVKKLNTLQIPAKNSEEYYRLRLLHDTIHEGLNDLIPPFSEDQFNTFSSGQKKILSIANEITQTLKEFDQKIIDYLSTIDPEVSNDSDFQHVSEAELWNNRTKTYKYVI